MDMQTSTDPRLPPLNRLVGTWTTEATHPGLPGVVVHGTVSVEWLEGGRFLIHRSRTDRPQVPDSISMIGAMNRDRDEGTDGPVDPAHPLQVHYFDSRGVFRVYETSLSGDTWFWSRTAPGFSQRFTGRFSDDGDTIVGRWQVCEDEKHWVDDLVITYRRRTAARTEN
jgi:hypothetical protein